MNHIAVIDYIEQWATNYIPIQHSEANKRFYLNIDQLRALHVNNVEAAIPFVLMEDRHTGGIGGNVDNFRDIPRYVFYILEKVEKDDHHEEEKAFDRCKIHAFKFIGRLRHDHDNEISDVGRFIQQGSINYRRVGPQLDNLHGCEISFVLSDNIESLTHFDPDDYLEPLPWE
jgi:hypothetical protein